VNCSAGISGTLAKRFMLFCIEVIQVMWVLIRHA
jgi:hypothetical protein